MAAIKLARELGVNFVLRSAFYDLNRIYFAPLPGDMWSIAQHRSTWDPAIEPADLKRLTGGRERLKAQIQTTLQSVSRGMRLETDGHRRIRDKCSALDPPPNTRVPSAFSWPCESVIHDWLKQEVNQLKAKSTADDIYDPSVYVDPITHLLEMGSKLTDPYHREFRVEGICMPCRKVVKDKLKKEAQKLWDQLPKLFDLPKGC